MQQDLLTPLDQALQGIYGAGAHTDWGVLTILATDENPGLQVFTEGKWAHVKPVPGTFIINLGDMLERCAAAAVIFTYSGMQCLDCTHSAHANASSPFAVYVYVWLQCTGSLPLTMHSWHLAIR